jgi:SpoVK/Ycf46/Vps4 family AAA+-type ATPase
MEEAKRRLAECVQWPLRYAGAFARLGVRPASGLLLYGPPGNGKTLLARGAAAQLRCSFLLVKGPELYSKYVGESERALAAVFQQARRQHPCLVFLDEIDALAPRRAAAGGGGGHVGERMLAVLLAQLDGVAPLRGVTVVGATNRPDQLDPALLRPGRLSHLLYVPLPDAPARQEMLLAALATAPRAPDELSDAAVEAFAREACEGCSGAECAAIAREAKLRALARGGPAVLRLADLHEARRACPPRTSPETIHFYETWRNV